MLAAGLPGDQLRPQLSMGANGGFLVWQDGLTDGDGLGIGGRLIDPAGSGDLGVFRVNVTGAGDQENPQVAALKDGGVAFAWQGGVRGSQKIFARFAGASRTFITGDVRVSSFAGGQSDPAIASLSDGNLVIVWTSDGQDGSMGGVYGQRFSQTGQKVGSEFRVAQSTQWNQRTPAVTALSDGRFAVVWISESGSDQSGEFSVDVVGRLFGPGGALGDETRLNSGARVCANPQVSGDASGGFTVVWGEKDGSAAGYRGNSWDIYARTFNAAGQARTLDQVVNVQRFGDQFAPRIAGKTHQMIVWTSLGQDGSAEGVVGRFVDPAGALSPAEFVVNTATANRQFDAAVAADGTDRFLVAWTGFIGGAASFELFAQRYDTAATLPALAAPIVSALDQTRLSVTWPAAAGLDVERYEVYMDDVATPVMVTANVWTATGLASGSPHTFRVAVQLRDGRRSALSAAGTGTTWGTDGNSDGLPDDWQSAYWGASPASWPAAHMDSDGDGATNLQEFLAGTDPSSATSVLRAELVSNGQASKLNWNTQTGLMYQVQSSLDLKNWSDLGTPRLATATLDSLVVNDTAGAAYYRVIRIR